MKRLALIFATAATVAGLLAAAAQVEAGGGAQFACQQDRDVWETREGPVLEVMVRDSCFGPGIARVAPGTELRWVNRGQQPHNLVDVALQKPTQVLPPGSSITMSFAQAGAFVYFCAFHPGMTGAVFVGDSLADSAPETVYKPASPSSAPTAAASAQLPARDGDGFSPFTVVLLALAVGTIAGGSSTLLTRRLDRR